MSTSLDAPVVKTETPRTGKRYVVLAGLCAASALAYGQRFIIGPLREPMAKELDLDNNRMGDAIALFFVTYALLQAPTGVASKRWSVRWTLAVYVGVFSLSAAAVGLVQGLFLLGFIRLVMGAGQAGLFPCTTTAVSRWFSGHERAIANGCIAGAMQIGTAVVSLMVAFLLGPMSWKELSVFIAIPGLLWAAWFAWSFRDWPVGVNGLQSDEQAAAAAFDREPTPWGRILSSPAMTFLSLQHFFRGAGSVFFGSWFVTYLTETRGINLKEAAGFNACPPIGILVGSVLGGFLSDGILRRTGSLRLARQGLSIVSCMACGVLVWLSGYADDPGIAVAIISVGSCIAALAGPCAYTATIDMGGKHVTQVFSIMNTAGNVGAAAFPYVVPRLVDLSGGNWNVVLILFAALYIGAGLCWLPIDPGQKLLVDDDERGE